MKYLLLVADGAAGYTDDTPEGKTCFQLAKTPNMDKLAKLGRCGKFKSIPDGMPCGSEIAILSVLGYDPKKCFTGRGALEAPGLGVDLKEDEIAFRCNLITEENGKIKDYSAGHISNEESAELIRLIDLQLGKPTIKFYPGVSYRHLLVLKGKDFSADLETMPPHDAIGKKIVDVLVKPKNDGAASTANILNKMIFDSKLLLDNNPLNRRRKEAGKNPANMIWPWSGGRKPVMKTFQELYKIEGAAIAAVDIIFGIGIYAGLKPIKVKGATGLHDTNYEGKADAAIKALKEYDFVFVHVEAPDEAGHSGDARLKIKTIEDFDKRCLGRILDNIDLKNTVIGILPDHPTPTKVKTHTADAVPFLIYNPKEKPDKVEEFNEFSVEKGGFRELEWDGFIRAFLGR
ncbi:cofactor-independent phosphoglycerate mutase [Candidatus Woesearchaeota archaeon]|nr:cofactor-independent phosphoglycerate mutase [Candidatus Woesearchaeota archaeon]